MPVTGTGAMGKNVYTNRTRRLLIVPLNSGETIHLAPGESTPPIEDVEVEQNRDVARLMAEQRLAAGERGEKEKQERERGGRRSGRQKRK
jgi:hypothetical protein